MPVTVIIRLFVNAAAPVYYSLCLLGCSGDRDVDVVCDDARKRFGMLHHWPDFDK